MDLQLLVCPFCGGKVRSRWSPWIDGESCWKIEHIDYEAAVAAKCPLEMGGYRDLEELSAAWNERKLEMAFDSFDRIELQRSFNRIAIAIDCHNAIKERKAHALERITDVTSRIQSSANGFGDR